MAEKKVKPEKEEIVEAPKELLPKPDCPICGGKGFVELVPGHPDIRVACTCKFK